VPICPTNNVLSIILYDKSQKGMGYALSICVAPTKKIIDNNDEEQNRIPSVEISQVIDFGNMPEDLQGIQQSKIPAD
jgi:hypothetical protein